MGILVSAFRTWTYKVRVEVFGIRIRGKFAIGAARQAELADDLVAEGFSETQAIVAVNKAMQWIDRIC